MYGCVASSVKLTRIVSVFCVPRVLGSAAAASVCTLPVSVESASALSILTPCTRTVVPVSSAGGFPAKCNESLPVAVFRT